MKTERLFSEEYMAIQTRGRGSKKGTLGLGSLIRDSAPSLIENRKSKIGDSISSALRKIKDMGIHFKKEISGRDLLFFTTQLSLMLETGTPLNTSIYSISTQIENPRFRGIINRIVADIEEGRLMSEAIERHPDIFSDIYISMVKAGEGTGNLHEMLNRLVRFQKKREEFIATIKKSMTYPVTLSILATFVVIFILTFVFPKFRDLFENIKDQLPITTKILMMISNLLVSYWYIVIIIFGVLAYSGYSFIKNDKGRLIIDRLKISMPFLSGIFIKIYVSQLMGILGFLIGSKVSLLDALRITRRGVSNHIFIGFIDKIVESVEKGEGLSPPFMDTPFIPETVRQMIKTGEGSRNLDTVMLRLAEYYDEEISNQMKILSTLIEPILLIMMGIVVGLIATSLILPIFKLSRAVR
ncbi:MAG: type II secretion system F family protein [Nitrospinae bacterium]|nr:type II secretion system F family protein [Nitrospinota bacterium]